MRIGIPSEVKDDEYRVALTPAGAEALSNAGHEVLVQAGAGEDSGFTDDFYQNAGARIAGAAEEVWARSEMIMKVKEPLPAEWPLIREDQILFTYFHFAASEPLTRAVMESGAVAIAYETVGPQHGELPLLTPMSEVAGRMAVQQGAKYLERPSGGSGILLGGVPGVLPAKVVILGGGVVGEHAARMAAGLGARVFVMDISLPRLRHLSTVMPANVNLLYSTRYAVRKQLTGRGPCHRRGPGAGREGPEADHPRRPFVDAEGIGHRGRGGRPVRLRGDDSADHPLRPGLRGRRSHSLRCREHSGCGAAHIDARTHQRHAAVRPGARRARLAAGLRGKPGSRPGDQRGLRQRHASGSGRGVQVAACVPVDLLPGRPAGGAHATWCASSASRQTPTCRSRGGPPMGRPDTTSAAARTCAFRRAASMRSPRG